MTNFDADFDKAYTALKDGDNRNAYDMFVALGNAGHAESQFRVGWMLARAHGIARDYRLAAQSFQPAALQNHAKAQYELAVMHYNAQGVIRNYNRAHIWANLAASNGDERGVILMNLIEEKMSQGQIDKAHADAVNWIISQQT